MLGARFIDFLQGRSGGAPIAIHKSIHSLCLKLCRMILDISSGRMHAGIRAECTEIYMGAFGAYLDVKLCSAWRLASEGGSRGVLSFWQWAKKHFFSEASRRFVFFVLGIRVISLLRCDLHLLHAL